MPKDDLLKSELDENLSKEMNADEGKEMEIPKMKNPADQVYPTDNQKSSSGEEEKDITG